MTEPRPDPPRARAPIVACFGEILWDCLPRGLFLGGAPMNVAYHLGRQGLRVRPITALGRDFLGDEALRRMAAWGVETDFIRRDERRATGTVRATIAANGRISYEIARAVAWDRITVAAARLRRAEPPVAIVFGTLALRENSNRRELDRLLAAWPQALRVVDLNLRAPFDGASIVDHALARAQVVKLNDEELSRLTRRRARTRAELQRAAASLAARTSLDRLCVTAGAKGAGLWWRGEWFWEDARRIEVRDTVGAGDAFLGGLLGALAMHGASPRTALRAASRLGEFVAMRDGATPDYALDARGAPVDSRAG